MSQFEKKHEGPVSVKFTVASFRYKGVEYKSAEVEKAAEAGNAEAIAIIANLVNMNSGVIEISPVTEEAQNLTPQTDDQDNATPKKKSKKKKGDITHE